MTPSKIIGSKIQPIHNSLQLIIRYPQISLGVRNTLVIELMHNKRQIHSLHPGVISPGFPQAVSADLPPKN